LAGGSKLREFLSHRSREFIERDVTQDKEAFSKLQKFGFMTIPAIVIDGEVVINLNRCELERLLET